MCKDRTKPDDVDRSRPDGESESSRIKWSVDTRHCAFCGSSLENKKIFGSGSFADGLFCSLDCYARLHGSRKRKKL